MKAAKKKRKKQATTTFRFSLVYEGIDELTEEIEDPLFEAGCNDATLGMCAGVMSMYFDRDAESFREALLSAIEAVESCNLPIRLVRVEPIEDEAPE